MVNTGIKLLLLAAGAVWMAILVIPDNKLHVVFCDVGQGDATLISLGKNQLLIDGGPGDKVLECLDKHMPFWDRTLEMAVVTHKQRDHEQGIIEAAKRYSILYFEPVLRKGQTVNMGNFEFRVLWPDDRILGENSLSEDNEEGIMGEVSYGNFEVLMTADANLANISEMQNIEVVKVPHHGSKGQWNSTWYQRSNPALTVISVGKNSYGHPASEVTEGLQKLGIKYLRTDQEGDIEIVSDGSSWKVVK